MAIGGKVRENVESIKKVGLFPAKVLCVNPSREEFKEILGIDLPEDSKQTEYLGESKEGNTTLRINIWVENPKKDLKTPVTFFLENKQKENKTEEGDGKVKKYQYINSGGTCTWGTDRDSLPDWFKKREFRIAFVGEEELYGFLRTWLGKLDFKDPDTTLQIEWKQLMKGNVKAIREQINGEYCTPPVCLATVKTVDKDGELKEYQSIWNKAFLPEYTLKQFRLTNFMDPSIQSQLKVKEEKNKTDKNVKLLTHERFVLSVIGEYGVKEFYKLHDLKDYDPAENVVSKSETLVNESATDDLPF